MVFSDGTPFDARAVKLNHDAVTAHRESHDWLELVKQIQETRVVDPHTVQVVLKDPYYPLLQDLALVRPVRYLSPSGFPEEGDTAKGIMAPIGTGPWVLSETRLGKYDVFTRNPRYWGPAPEIERIVVKVPASPATRPRRRPRWRRPAGGRPPRATAPKTAHPWIWAFAWWATTQSRRRVHRPELTGVSYGATKFELPFEVMRHR